MFRILHPFGGAALAVMVCVQTQASDQVLTLADAIDLAVTQDDPSVSQFRAQAQSQRETAEADAQLPDPRVRFGIANLATDTFNFNQEPMTQLQFGVHQTIPTAGRRRFQRARGEANGEVLDQMAAARALILTMEIENLWLKLLNLQATQLVVKDKKQRLNELLRALSSRYETGQSSAQAVLAMEAELAIIDDRLQSLIQTEEALRALFSRYIGVEAARRSVSGSYSDVTVPAALPILEQRIMDHPELLQEQARIRASEHSVSLAQESYKPNWGVDLGYGYRAAGRADFASAMVTLDVPIFTAKRQDKRLSAAKQNRQAARLSLQAKELEMVKNIRASHAVWQKSADRIVLYETVVLQRAMSASDASENAYASGTADFAEIIRTHLSELDARLKLEAIRLERALAQTQLNYYAGGRS